MMVLSQDVSIVCSNSHLCNTSFHFILDTIQRFLREFIENPEKELFFVVAERYSDHLHDNMCRYSFVCSAIITLCSGPKNFEK